MAVPTYVGFPNGTTVILAVVLLVVPFLFLPGMVRTIAEYQRGILFRFGQLVGAINPGLNIIFPFGIDRLVKIDLRTFTIDVAKQEIITKDNIPVLVDAVVYFNVFDPVLSVIKVANYTQSTTLLGQTILRSILGKHDLDEILSNRSALNEMLRELLDEATDPWGIKVTTGRDQEHRDPGFHEARHGPPGRGPSASVAARSSLPRASSRPPNASPKPPKSSARRRPPCSCAICRP